MKNKFKHGLALRFQCDEEGVCRSRSPPSLDVSHKSISAKQHPLSNLTTKMLRDGSPRYVAVQSTNRFSRPFNLVYLCCNPLYLTIVEIFRSCKLIDLANFYMPACIVALMPRGLLRCTRPSIVFFVLQNYTNKRYKGSKSLASGITNELMEPEIQEPEVHQ